MPCYLSAVLIKVLRTISGLHVEALRILRVVLLWKVSSVSAIVNFRLYFVWMFISDGKEARKDLAVSQ